MTNPNPSKNYFNMLASKWDRIRTGFYSESLREFVTHKAFLHPDMIVADIGAGSGFMAAGLAGEVSRVHVVDGSPLMLVEAQRNLAGFDNVTYHEADISQLPFEDGSLDVVFANMVLHHIPDPHSAIHEMTRVLRPGGRLLISNMETYMVDRRQAAMVEIYSFFSRSHIRNWLEESGLVNIVVADAWEKNQSRCTNEAATGIFYASGTRRVSGMRELVQEEYGSLAEKNSGCCSSPTPSDSSDCCSQPVISLEPLQEAEVVFTQGYSLLDQAEVPPEAANFSLGCGNPIAMAGLNPGEVVLDIGSGGGLDSFLAAKRVGTAGRVIGVDMTPAMLKRSRRSAKLNGYTNVEFRRGDAANLPVEDETIDVVLSNCVINLTEDKGKVFAEAYRVLKPGGRLEISDMVFDGPVDRKTRAAATGWSDCVTGALIEEEMLDLVVQAGFTAGKIRRSGSYGQAGGASIYSVQLSAVKPL